MMIIAVPPRVRTSVTKPCDELLPAQDCVLNRHSGGAEFGCIRFPEDIVLQLLYPGYLGNLPGGPATHDMSDGLIEAGTQSQ